MENTCWLKPKGKGKSQLCIQIALARSAAYPLPSHYLCDGHEAPKITIQPLLVQIFYSFLIEVNIEFGYIWKDNKPFSKDTLCLN